MESKEIECRFLEVDKGALVKKLRALGAEDEGESLLRETIIYDRELKWRDEMKFLRLRTMGARGTVLTYKEHRAHTVDGTYEIEVSVEDHKTMEHLLTAIGFVAFRHQEKMRHTFRLDGVTLDIDTWPRIPAYVEMEGASEAALKAAAGAVGYDWKDADLHNARWVIENKYGIPVGNLHWFTFGRCE